MVARHHQHRRQHSPVGTLVVVLMLLAVFFITAKAVEGSVVFQSTDGGRSWSLSDQGLPGHARLNAFGSTGDSLLAGTDVGIFISHDQGHTWQPSAGVARSSGRVVGFTTLGRRVFAGTDRSGMLESSDKGITWALNQSLATKNIRTVLGHKGTLYVGTDAQGVFSSNDCGRSWDRLANGLPQNAQVFALAALKETLFAALYSKGLYRWDARTRQWRKTGPVSPLALATIGGTLIVGHNPGGIYITDDLGERWSKAAVDSFGDFAFPVPVQPSELSSDLPVWELSSSADLVFAGVGSGIFCSEDKGRTWTRARHGLPEESPGIAFLLKGKFILAATPGWITNQ